MKTIIHVNRAIIDANRKQGTTAPALSVSTYKGTRRASTVHLLDAAGQIVAQVVYRPHHPRPCGARVWIETNLTVVCDAIITENQEDKESQEENEEQCPRSE